MRHAEFLIKPVSQTCNIDCKYCFYKDISNRRETRDYGNMSLETLETIVARAYAETKNQVVFAFQGGEPMMRGISFFRAFFNYVDKYNINRIPTEISLQTNGTLITDEWAELFKMHNVLVGVSLDGPESVHNKYRIDYKHAPTFKHVMRGIDILRKHQVEFNILTVLTNHVARNIKLIYPFFKEQGFNFIQFIEVLDRNFTQNGKETYSLSNDDYYYFLQNCFDLWYKDFIAGQYISIRLFDVMIHKILGNESAVPCFSKGLCQNQNIIEANGDVFSCDFYVTEEETLGNIMENSLEDILKSQRLAKFIKESLPLPDSCKGCKFYSMCRNGCKRYRVDGKYYYCRAVTKFYEMNLPRLFELASIVRQVNASQAQGM